MRLAIGGMSLSVSLADVGRPVAYYPRLARFFGSVNAAILFAQLHYWSQCVDSELGVYKTSDDETGLSYREQVTARKYLRSRNFLIETLRRLEHRVYYRLDMDAVDAAFDEWSQQQSANDENAVREKTKTQTENYAQRTPEPNESSSDELRQAQSVNSTEITNKTTAESVTAKACAKAAPMVVAPNGAVYEIPAELK